MKRRRVKTKESGQNKLSLAVMLGDIYMLHLGNGRDVASSTAEKERERERGCCEELCRVCIINHLLLSTSHSRRSLHHHNIGRASSGRKSWLVALSVSLSDAWTSQARSCSTRFHCSAIDASHTPYRTNRTWYSRKHPSVQTLLCDAHIEIDPRLGGREREREN